MGWIVKLPKRSACAGREQNSPYPLCESHSGLTQTKIVHPAPTFKLARVSAFHRTGSGKRIDMTPIAQLGHILPNAQIIEWQADERGCGQTMPHGLAALFGPGHQFARQRHCVGVLLRCAIMPDRPHDHKHLSCDRHDPFVLA